ncbi:hypothetical protein [Microbacterium sp.]|uniref:hypothetical protein n=1 Tax=Microbacterium sp. TaxID=51671 RepID=UPI002D793DB2|nr:hypothetical protein [Microbacterium sp.]HET6300581.1 hypothetical protein [Microbacterium sp.]
MVRGPALGVVLAGALALTGCAAPEGELGPLGRAGCDPASPTVGMVTEATASDGVTAFGLLETADPRELAAGDTVHKLVVRMTGSGDVSAEVVRPDGSTRDLSWGPESHASSNFDRPGDEWGIGFALDELGCWEIRLAREGGDSASFWFAVDEG